MTEVRLPAPVKAIHDPGLQLWHQRAEGAPRPSPGTFRWGRANLEDGGADYLWFVCPCGCGDERSIRVREAGAPKEGPAWDWDGNRDEPTLSPSIYTHLPDGSGGSTPHWHGWLRGGVFIQA